jgi:hypothetical protein
MSSELNFPPLTEKCMHCSIHSEHNKKELKQVRVNQTRMVPKVK